MTSLSNHVRHSRYAFEYRITILGDKMTGKSSLLSRFTSNTFTHRYRPTIEEQIPHIIQHQGSVWVCLFIDTCGGNDFPAMRRLEISKGNAFMVLYAINDRNSFHTSQRIIEEIIEEKAEGEGRGEELKIVLIGSKSDLCEDREVEYEEGERLSRGLQQKRSIKADFYEVSAMIDDKVSLAFEALLSMYAKPESSVIQRRRSSSSRLSLRRPKKNSAKSKQTLADLQKRNSMSDSALDRIADICVQERLPALKGSPKDELEKPQINRNYEKGKLNFRCNSASPKLRMALLNDTEGSIRKGSFVSDSEVETLSVRRKTFPETEVHSASPKNFRRGGGEKDEMREASPKHFWQRTLNSMQRILGVSSSPN